MKTLWRIGIWTAVLVGSLSLTPVASAQNTALEQQLAAETVLPSFEKITGEVLKEQAIEAGKQVAAYATLEAAEKVWNMSAEALAASGNTGAAWGALLNKMDALKKSKFMETIEEGLKHSERIVQLENIYNSTKASGDLLRGAYDVHKVLKNTGDLDKIYAFYEKTKFLYDYVVDYYVPKLSDAAIYGYDSYSKLDRDLRTSYRVFQMAIDDLWYLATLKRQAVSATDYIRTMNEILEKNDRMFDAIIQNIIDSEVALECDAFVNSDPIKNQVPGKRSAAARRTAGAGGSAGRGYDGDLGSIRDGMFAAGNFTLSENARKFEKYLNGNYVSTQSAREEYGKNIEKDLEAGRYHMLVLVQYLLGLMAVIFFVISIWKVAFEGGQMQDAPLKAALGFFVMTLIVNIFCQVFGI